MVAQANVIANWGSNVYVKLPVTTTRGEPLFQTVRALSRDGVKINLTAIFGADQVVGGIEALAGGAPACVSVWSCRSTSRHSATNSARRYFAPRRSNSPVSVAPAK